MRAVLIAGFDSSLKYAARVADALAEGGADPELLVPTSEVPHRLADAQIRATTDRAPRFLPWDAVVAAAAAADVVVPVFDGPVVERFIRAVHLRSAPGARPVIGAGWIGMALYDLVGGYLMRSLADVLAVNTGSDLALFRGAAHGLGLADGNLLLTGLPLLPATPAPPRRGPIRTVLFADQPTVPRAEADRVILWDRVAAYAALHPDRTVLFKPRHRPGEDTFHRMRVAPEGWAATRSLPENLRFDYTPIARQVGEVDLLITVSSTAALEAIAHGGRVAFAADRVDDASLNPPLLPSGLLRPFDAIDRDEVGDPDPAWLADVFPAAGGAPPAARFAARLVEVASGSSPRVHEAMWDSAFHVGRREGDAAREALRRGGRRSTPRRVTAGALRRVLRAVER